MHTYAGQSAIEVAAVDSAGCRRCWMMHAMYCEALIGDWETIYRKGLRVLSGIHQHGHARTFVAS